MNQIASLDRKGRCAALIAAVAAVTLLGCSGESTTGGPSSASSPASSFTSIAPSTSATTSIPAPITVETTVAPIDSTTSTTSSAAPATTAATTTTAVAEPVAAAPSLARPIVAVDGEGDAVLITSYEGAAVPLLDGDDPDGAPPAEGPGPLVVGGIAAAGDGNVWVGLCCEPAAGSVVPVSRTGERLVDEGTKFGHAPALDPTGRFLATAQINGFPIGILELPAGIPLPAPAGDINERFEPHDAMWVDERSLAVVGSRTVDGVPTIVVHHVSVIEGSLAEIARGIVAPDDGDTRFRFAGSPEPGRFALHAIGGASAAVHTFGDAQPPGAGLSFPGPTRSYWISADGPEVWVDVTGVLRVDGTAVPGEYRWAR